MLAELDIDRGPVSLEDLLVQAPALTRVDRKYLVPLGDVQLLLDRLGAEWQWLRVGRRRTTHYRSTYIDTDDLTSARAHVQRRRLRWKARSRLYVEDDLCRFEVKIRDGRGRTVKLLEDRPPTAYGQVTDLDRAFVARTLGSQGLEIDVDRLVSTAEVTYERMTLARLDEPCRLTIDWGMHSCLGAGEVRLNPEYVVVETKGGLRAAEPDRLLLAMRHRPRPFSKYTATASLLGTGVPDNDVRSLVGRALHVSREAESQHEEKSA